MTSDSSILSCCRTLADCSETALLVVDANHTIVQFIMPQSPGGEKNWSHFIGKSFLRFATHIFGTRSPLLRAYYSCCDSGEQQQLTKLEHLSSRNLQEFFHCRITRLSAERIVICLKKITDSVMIEEEFIAMSAQYNELSLELTTAISNLDFQLMDLEQAKKKISALYKITASAQNASGQSAVIREILQGIRREFGFSDASIWLWNADANALQLERSLNDEEGSGKPAQPSEIPLALTQAASAKELIYVDATTNPEQIYFSEVAIPLLLADVLLGALHVKTSEERILQLYDLDLLRSLGSQISLTLAHATHVSTVERLAVTDGLTSLYNKRYFSQRLDEEVKRSLRYNRPLSLLMIDIDHFKRYNDTNGHLRGDAALKDVAQIIKTACRDVDFVARYGGEEFTAILPETEAHDAYCLAERIRKRIEEEDFPDRDALAHGKLTVSIGISCCPDSACSAEKLIDHADIALYKVKHASRNAVAIYSI